MRYWPGKAGGVGSVVKGAGYIPGCGHQGVLCPRPVGVGRYPLPGPDWPWERPRVRGIPGEVALREASILRAVGGGAAWDTPA